MLFPFITLHELPWLEGWQTVNGKLETRFVRAYLIEVYKIFNGLNSLDSGRYSVQNVGVTRGHIFKRFKKRVSLDVGRYRVCNEWNLLTKDVVSARWLYTFKVRLDHHLRNVKGFIV